MSIKTLICIACMTIAGCANAPQPVKIGKDTWMIEQRHAGGFFSTVSSGAQMKDASVFCQSMGKELQVVDTQDDSLPAMWSRSHGVFNCFDKNDPRYREGNLRPDKGVQTVTHQ